MKNALRRLIDGQTRDDRRLRIAIILSVIMIGVWLGVTLAKLF